MDYFLKTETQSRPETKKLLKTDIMRVIHQAQLMVLKYHLNLQIFISAVLIWLCVCCIHNQQYSSLKLTHHMKI